MYQPAAQAAAVNTHAACGAPAHLAAGKSAAARGIRPCSLRERMKTICRTWLVAAMTMMSAGCIVPLLPGAAQVKVTTDPKDVSGCTDVGNVSGAGADLSNIYLHQMQNQAVAMDADTVYRSGNGGIAYRCKKPAAAPQ